jgi:hypothetical protein
MILNCLSMVKDQFEREADDGVTVQFATLAST